MPSPALITFCLANTFPNRLKVNIPNNFEINPLFCSFVSFLIILINSYINNPDSSSDSAISVISSISSFEVIDTILLNY